MFVIEVMYKVPLEKIAEYQDAHIAFLIKNYEAGKLIASGPKVPRTGGFILAAGDVREEIDALILDDPFNQNGLADYRITQFTANRKAQNTQDLIG